VPGINSGDSFHGVVRIEAVFTFSMDKITAWLTTAQGMLSA